MMKECFVDRVILPQDLGHFDPDAYVVLVRSYVVPKTVCRGRLVKVSPEAIPSDDLGFVCDCGLWTGLVPHLHPWVDGLSFVCLLNGDAAYVNSRIEDSSDDVGRSSGSSLLSSVLSGVDVVDCRSCEAKRCRDCEGWSEYFPKFEGHVYDYRKGDCDKVRVKVE